MEKELPKNNCIDKIVIIINGKGGVGKDTICDFISKYYSTRKVSSITPILTIAKTGGWDGKKDDKSRKLLSDLKILFTNYNDLSFNYLKSQIEEFLLTSDRILFIHMREPEEITKFVKYLDSLNIKNKTLLVKRKGFDEKIYNNESDDNVDNYDYDIIFHNDIDITENPNNLLEFFKINILN